MVQYVLITGCTEGSAGDALAQEFHAKGVHVFATARDLSKVKHLTSKGIDILALDVLSADSIAKAVAAVSEKTGGQLDYLVNNSGRGYSMPVVDSDLSISRDVFETNVFGLLAVTQAFLPLLIATKGSLINISSMNSRASVPYMGVYNASKAAVTSLSDNLRIELEPFGVKVITIVAGTIKTAFFMNQPNVTLPQGSIYEPVSDEFSAILADEGPGTMDADKYARGVVANILKKNPSVYYWRGGYAFTVWLLTTFLWHGFTDSYFSQQGKLNVLKARLSTAKNVQN